MINKNTTCLLLAWGFGLASPLFKQSQRNNIFAKQSDELIREDFDNVVLTEENCNDLERVQKSAVRIMLGTNYRGYRKSLNSLQIDTLKDRRDQLCLSFAQKCIKIPKTRHMFPEKEKVHQMLTRNPEKFKVEHATLKDSKTLSLSQPNLN